MVCSVSRPSMTLVHGLLDGRGLAAPPRTVGGDERLGLGHFHAFPHGRRREAAEHHVVRRADPGAGQHGHDDLGDHRQVDADHVALADPPGLQPVGQALNVGQDLGVGQRPFLALLTVPVEGDPVPEAGVHVPVEAVVGGVERAVGEPGVERRVAVVQDLAERGLPVQPAARLLGPPGGLVSGGNVVHAGVGHLSVLGKFLGWRERRDFLELDRFVPAGRTDCGLRTAGSARLAPSATHQKPVAVATSPHVRCGAAARPLWFPELGGHVMSPGIDASRVFALKHASARIFVSELLIPVSSPSTTLTMLGMLSVCLT